MGVEPVPVIPVRPFASRMVNSPSNPTSYPVTEPLPVFVV